MSRKVRAIVIAVSSCLVAVSFVLNTAIVTAKYYEGRILPNTIVSGLNIGGTKTEEAASLIKNQAGSIVNQPLTMQLNGSTATATSSQLGVLIDENSTLENLIAEKDSWAWAKYSYWKNFFSHKARVMVYTVDEQKLTDTLNVIFPVSQEAKDAAIVVNNGQLETKLAEQGVTIDIANIKTNLESLVANASPPPPVTLDFTSSMPTVTDEVASQTRTEILSVLKPIYLVDNGKAYRIDVRDILPHITFEKEGNKLIWRVTNASLQNLIKSKLTKYVNVNMRPRTIMSDSGLVTDNGQEGRQLDVVTLSNTLYQMIQNRQFNTAETAITIPVNPIAITEKTVTPSFVLGQYEGKYITINLADQKMYLIENKNLIATYTVSSGKWSTPTPKGTFYIRNKIDLAYSRPFRLYMPWWNALAANPDGSGYKGVGIHGLPCFNRDCTRREGESHIGTPVSHGCVRVDDAGAQFVYSWAPVGTPIVIN